jgi:chromosome segregation ATPase
VHVLNDKVLDLGTQATKMKIDAHMQERLNVEQYIARESVLLEQIKSLKQQLGSETDLINVNQDLIRRLVTQRVDLELELGGLKNRYLEDQRKVEEEYQSWKRKYEMEQNALTRVEEEYRHAQEEQARLELELANRYRKIVEQERLASNVKLFLKQGRTDDALRYLEE